MICLRIGAVNAEDRPLAPRQYSVWCSQRDIAQMIERCIAAPESLCAEARLSPRGRTSRPGHKTMPTSSPTKCPRRNRLPLPAFVCTLIGSSIPHSRSPIMLDNLFKSFDGLLKEKHSLSAKADQLARNERTACGEAEPRAGRVGLPRGPRLRRRFRPAPRGRQDARAHQAAPVPEMRADVRSSAADVPASEGHARCHGGRQEEGPEEDRVTPGLRAGRP